MLSSTLRDVFVIVFAGLRKAYQWVRPYTLWAVWSVLLALILINAVAFYQYWRTRELSIYVGPPGTSSEEWARLIGERVTADSDGWIGTSYRVRYVFTDGFESNRHHVSNDRKGSSIGLTHDGFGDSSNVAILSPLEGHNLQAICSRAFLKRTAVKPSSPATPKMLSDLVADIRPGRVFVGSPGSGTRQLAEIVLAHHSLDVDEVAAPGVGELHDLLPALLDDRIDVAFFAGPLDAPLLQRVAKANVGQLIGLNGFRDAIVQQHRSVLYPVELNRGLYGATNDFCPGILESLASRRVLICSKSMRDADAYFIAKATTNALRDKISIDWSNSPPDPKNRDARPFAFGLHPGAEHVRDDEPPPRNWVPALSTLAVALAVFLVGQVAAWISGQGTNAPAPQSSKPEERAAEPSQPTPQAAEPPARSLELYQRLFRYIHIVNNWIPPVPPSVFEEYRRLAMEVDRNIRQGRETHRLADDDFDALSAGLAYLLALLAQKGPTDQANATQPQT